MIIEGAYIEPGTSRTVPAQLGLGDKGIAVTAAGTSRAFVTTDFQVSKRLASVPRLFEFSDGSSFSTADNDGVDALLESLGIMHRPSMVDRMERKWGWALVALIALPVSLWVLFSYGMPILAKPLAHAMPDRVVFYLDDTILEFLEDQVLQPSELPAERQEHIMELAEQLPAGFEIDLLFRGGGEIGANALALPGGTVVITDELVELSEFDGELVAIFAHESGHVESRHGLRNLIQSVGAVTVLTWVFGDLTLVTDLALVSVPALLQQLSYSREFEKESDEIARMILEESGYSAACMASIMTRLKAHVGRDDDNIPSIIKTHPGFDERIAAASGGAPCTR